MKLTEHSPNLVSEWHPKNLAIEQFSHGSTKKVWWICDEGHEWQMAIKHRTLQNQNCPYCAGKYVVKGFNDLEITHPALFAQLADKSKVVSRGSDTKVKWLCPLGHTYSAAPSSRVSNSKRGGGSGCPYCDSKKVLKGFNDLETSHPEIFLELEDQTALLTGGSNIGVWWICPGYNHRYLATPKSRANGHGCPYCSGQKVLPGFNDLEYRHPDIYEELVDKNVSLTGGSGRAVLFRCKECSHEWLCKVYNRTKNRSNCPECSKRLRSSIGEKEVGDYVKSLGHKVVHNARGVLRGRLELDIYIPESNKAIEYNGDYWHSFPEHQERDARKAQLCLDAGIDLMVVWESEWRETVEKMKEDIRCFLLATQCDTMVVVVEQEASITSAKR